MTQETRSVGRVLRRGRMKLHFLESLLETNRALPLKFVPLKINGVLIFTSSVQNTVIHELLGQQLKPP